MVSCSNWLLALVNVLTFVLSIPILGAGIWLATREGATECENMLQTPILVLGVFIMIISLVGLSGACCRSSGLRCLYLIMMFLLIVVLVFHTMFTYAVTNVEAGEALTAKGSKEHGFHDYSMWLKHRVYDEKNWIKIKSCLANSKICTQLADKDGHGTAEKSHGKSLSGVQSGCCKPSNDCKFTYIQQTIWNKTNGDFTNPDCLKWDNEPDTLCYNCNSCKAGLLEEIKVYWKKIAQMNIAVLVLLIIIYIIGCCSYASGNMNNTAAYRQNPYAQNPYQNNPHAQNPYYAQNPYANNPGAYKQMNP